jgi:hypothetical protein
MSTQKLIVDTKEDTNKNTDKDKKPIFPWSISIHYRSLCPKGISGSCQGFIRQNYNGKLTGVLYCHDRQCKELFPQMLKCPCSNAFECEGSFWEDEINVCVLAERLKKNIVKHNKKNG